MSMNEKRTILQKKIKILRERKENMKGYFLTEDDLFFYHSLDQKMHNFIEELEETKLSLEKIVVNLFHGDNIRNNLMPNEEEQYEPKSL